MEHSSEIQPPNRVGEQVLNELRFLSQVFESEPDETGRVELARRARKAWSKARHPMAGPVPQPLIEECTSRELAEAITQLPPVTGGGLR